MDIRLKRAFESRRRLTGTACSWTGCGRAESRGGRRSSTSGRRELAPTAELPRWFGHDPDRFEEFRRRYSSELTEHESKLQELRQRAKDGTLTLVYGARDTEHNDAVVLAEVMRTVA